MSKTGSAPTVLVSLYDMADQRAPQTVKKSKGVVNRLKKVFGLGSQSTPPADPVPAPAAAEPVPAPAAAARPASPIVATTTNAEGAAKLRAKYTHFRILVIGRANAGKTTVLKRVCDTNEDPVYAKVRDQFSLIPHSYLPFTNRLTQPRRCHDLCPFI